MGRIDEIKEAQARAKLVAQGVIPALAPVIYQRPAPRCPNCGTGRRIVMDVHRGEASSWECMDCAAIYTRAGETKSSVKSRKGKQQPPRSPYPAKLPCGCPGDGRVTVYQRAWGHSRHVECNQCLCWWEPRSNDPSGRRLAQGETVHTQIHDEHLDMPPPPAIN